MTIRAKPPRPPQPWKVYHLFDLGKRQGKKSDYLKAVPVLILEKWVQEERKDGVANYAWTKDIKERLEKCGLVRLVPKASGGIFGSMTSTQQSRNLTPPLIENKGEGMFWINLPYYEPLLQEYREKYCKDYPEDYKKLFPAGEPDWGSPPSKGRVEHKEAKPKPAVSETQDEIQSLLVPVEQALRERQQVIERLKQEIGKLQAEFQTALNNVKDAKTRAEAAETKVAQLEEQFAKIKNKSEYIHSSRIAELRSISSRQFDLTRLIELCEELNDNYAKGNVLAVPMLVRAIIDHIPPILGHNTFNEITNNYGGSQAFKSFKKSMQNLQNSLRNIADASIHSTIRSKETLPNSTQIDFSPDLDVLLAEIVRILK